MPEGHTIHRAASDQLAMLGRQKLTITSPQGRFADGAAAISGLSLRAIDAYGKHLLYRFPKATLHVHLGLYGDFYDYANADAPPPRPTPRRRGRRPASAS